MARKNYSIHWEEDVPVSYEVNSVQYESLDDIPDEQDRHRLEAMIDSASDGEFDSKFGGMDRELQQMSKVPVERIILTVFSGVAVLMLLIAGIASVNNILKINREEQAAGRVVEMIERRHYVNEQDRVIEEYYYPVVDYASNDGKHHSVQLSEGSSRPAYEVGEEVIVLYEPAHLVLKLTSTQTI